MRRSLINKRHGLLLVVEELPDEIKHGRKRRMVNSKCECGKIVKYSYDDFICRQSCGCLNLKRKQEQKLTHGLTTHPLFLVWQNMKNRCYNEKVWAYQYYGAKGIAVCEEWINNFKNFFDWSILNGWEAGLTLDRYPNKNGNYAPLNCRWTTQKAQCNNRTNNVTIEYNGEANTLAYFSEKFKIPYKLLHSRIKRLKWEVSKAIETEILYKN